MGLANGPSHGWASAEAISSPDKSQKCNMEVSAARQASASAFSRRSVSRMPSRWRSVNASTPPR